jgi:uncharacterized protein (DUF433 family)
MGAVSPQATSYAHIRLDQDGAAYIRGTTIKVAELVMAQKTHDWRPEDLQVQYPYLRMSQIYAALAYYWDSQDTLESKQTADANALPLPDIDPTFAEQIDEFIEQYRPALEALAR